MKKFVITGASAQVAEVKPHATKDGVFLVILTDDLSSVHKGLVNNNGRALDLLSVNEQFISLTKDGNSLPTIPVTLSVMSQAGNILFFDVEEVVVGDKVYNNDGTVVTGENGVEEVYKGKKDGSSKKGDIFYHPTNFIFELGDNAKSMTDKLHMEVAVQVAVDASRNYVPKRAAAKTRSRINPTWSYDSADQAPADKTEEPITAAQIQGKKPDAVTTEKAGG